MLQLLNTFWEDILRIGFHRYLVSGGSAFFLEYGSFFVLLNLLHVQLYLANSLSFALGLSVSFLLNRNWTFKKETYHRKSHHQFVMYLLLALLNLFMTNLIIGSLKHFGLSPLVGKIIAMGLIIGWNFSLFNKVIFKQTQQH
jgi:putative flippase GtrA